MEVVSKHKKKKKGKETLTLAVRFSQHVLAESTHVSHNTTERKVGRMDGFCFQFLHDIFPAGSPRTLFSFLLIHHKILILVSEAFRCFG